MSKKTVSITILIIVGLGLVLYGTQYMGRGVSSVTSPNLDSSEGKSSVSATNTTNLPSRYEVRDGQLLLWGKRIETRGVDLATLTAASEELEGGFHFLKDKNNVYVDAYNALAVVPNADPVTFSALGCSMSGGCYAKDNKAIYHVANGNIISIVKDVDIASFNFVPRNAGTSSQVDASDSRHEYFAGRIVATQPKEKFESVGGSYYKGEGAIYKETTIACAKGTCAGPLVRMDYDVASFKFIGVCKTNEPADRSPDISYAVKDIHGAYCGDKATK